MQGRVPKGNELVIEVLAQKKVAKEIEREPIATLHETALAFLSKDYRLIPTISIPPARNRIFG